jgi:hypothetical protein
MLVKLPDPHPQFIFWEGGGGGKELINTFEGF